MKKVKESCVFIKLKHTIALTNEEFETSGSGFFISKDGLIATNYHVIQPSLQVYSWLFPAPVKEIKVYINSGSADYKTYYAYVAAIDKKNDLAILALYKPLDVNFLDLLPTDSLFESLPIWVFGYPFGEKFTILQRGPEISINNGTITALRHDDIETLTSIQLNASVNYGNSGGPLVNDEGIVAGIINIAGESNMNFAVPSFYLDSLIQLLPEISYDNDSVDIAISCNEQGTFVFLDSTLLGVTPTKKFRIKKGLHNLLFQKEGYHSLIKNECVVYDREIVAEMLPITVVDVLSGGGNCITVKSTLADFPLIDTIYTEDFDDNVTFSKWEQYTGGTDERTWFLEGSQLQQFENNSVLHAIYLGDRNWDNYRIDAKLKIITDGNDSRAGIIFRETDRGFCLIRLHKESNKVQLAYHSKKPFGWFIIKEVNLVKDITDEWYNLTIISSDSTITCFLNDEWLLNAKVPYSDSGMIGFYSVESKAVFDDLVVSGIDMNQVKNSEYSHFFLSFWFSDYFNFDSDSWFTYNKTQKIPESWLYTDYSCAQIKTDADLHTMTFKKYYLNNFSLQVDISFGNQSEKSMFELFFRNKDDKKLSLLFDKRKRLLTLSEHDGPVIKILKKEKIKEDFFNSIYSFVLLVNDDTVKLTSKYNDLMSFKGKKILNQTGEFGFGISGQTLTLYKITVASPRE
ncbi:MAG: trypsin-like peptidase domain-containing protein [Bacteroidota bacterium]